MEANMKACHVFLSLVVSLFVTTTVWAQPTGLDAGRALRVRPGFRAPIGLRGLRPGVWPNLRLDPMQKLEVADLRLRFAEQYGPDRVARAAMRSEIETLWETGVPDRQAILVKSAKILALSQKLRAARVDFSLAVYNLLKPEQRVIALETHFRRGAALHDYRQDCCGCGLTASVVSAPERKESVVRR
jgi:Spy/CpxP family protein refolding chaperone